MRHRALVSAEIPVLRPADFGEDAHAGQELRVDDDLGGGVFGEPVEDLSLMEAASVLINGWGGAGRDRGVTLRACVFADGQTSPCRPIQSRPSLSAPSFFLCVCFCFVFAPPPPPPPSLAPSAGEPLLASRAMPITHGCALAYASPHSEHRAWSCPCLAAKCCNSFRHTRQ